MKSGFNLTIPIPILAEESKLTFIFTLLCGVSKGFMKTFKAFIKPCEAPQRSVKINIQGSFYLTQVSKMHGAGRVKT